MTDYRSSEETGPATPRQRAIEVYGNARDRVSNAGRRAGETIEEAPLLVVAAGIAAGAAIAALLPRSKTEDRLLRPVTDRARETARTAVRAAKDAGQSRLDELGLTRQKGSDAIRSILEGASDAAKASTQAALWTIRQEK
jgi:hypothetical protein